ncbi:hypothetical protein UCRPA7_4587 [Phaeoacremonium minimum UCRPA7]|uniref:Kinetoplast-associated protein KAP n=1 Tax=Phaeoacremonium minimum (strain UCR-PA7) TaxID=1286976 RepID=R8BKJ7_PHAM7|nr:hypothetical protein UCRPA7_4587 [Phaeoacremonium minimum UCRPA7]EON99883.1 hypothetical protein UCRPA7_4587 [Phaeoacremonium minimum UCRPA7]
MLNLSTPPTSRRTDKVEVKTYTSHVSPSDGGENEGDEDSSPFLTNVREAEQDVLSPAKARHSRIMSGNELSPLKILQASTSSSSGTEAPPSSKRQSMSMQMPPPRSPRKISPLERRFPIKVGTPLQTSFQAPAETAVQTPVQPPAETPRARLTHERQMSLEEAISENTGLKHAIEIFEDDESVLENGVDGDGDNNTATISIPVVEEEEEHGYDEMAGADDTMVSTLSSFSAVPNMTMFARLGQTPVRGQPAAMSNATPMATPRAGPLPNRGPPQRDSGNTTNLLDFTEQLRFPHGRAESPSKNGASAREPAVAKTPQRQSLANLLDFDIPPLPTPRSIPTVTPRELESLKSNFLSEISSLKATLSGKEAEVTSLKAALGDAEKRAGEYGEQLREERTLREQLAVDKDTWEKRGREMESILRKVKEEIVLSQREREDLEFKLDEAEKRREAAEMMAQDAESKMAGMRAGKLTAEGERVESPSGVRSPASKTQKEVEIAVERVARELHALYKGKHETKVAALKESYKGRWEKKVRELEVRLEDLAKENEDLRIGRDATMTKVDPNAVAAEEERREQAAKDSAQIKELGAEVQKLEATVKSVQNDNSELRRLLELERVEKGELVILAEEMMSMQQSFVATEDKRPASAGIPSTKAQPGNENARASGPRTSMLKTPGSISRTGESRIGRMQQPHERKQSIGMSGIARPGSGQAVRNGIMSSIEKMGSYRGRGD